MSGDTLSASDAQQQLSRARDEELKEARVLVEEWESQQGDHVHFMAAMPGVLSDLESTWTVVQAKLKGHQMRLQGQLSQLEAKHGQDKAALGDVEWKKGQAMEGIVKLEAGIRNMKSATGDLEQHLARLQDQTQRLRLEMAQFDEQTETRMRELQSAISTQRAAGSITADLRARVTAKEAAVEKVAAEHDAAEREHKDLLQICDNIMKQLEAKQQ